MERKGNTIRQDGMDKAVASLDCKGEETYLKLGVTQLMDILSQRPKEYIVIGSSMTSAGWPQMPYWSQRPETWAQPPEGRKEGRNTQNDKVVPSNDVGTANSGRKKLEAAPSQDAEGAQWLSGERNNERPKSQHHLPLFPDAEPDLQNRFEMNTGCKTQ